MFLLLLQMFLLGQTTLMLLHMFLCGCTKFLLLLQICWCRRH